ncbi:putative fkbp12-associated protein [Pyronema omphalodes]|nr:putative fkbp12-associated protein [Pyronema omphalodes]
MENPQPQPQPNRRPRHRPPRKPRNPEAAATAGTAGTAGPSAPTDTLTPSTGNPTTSTRKPRNRNRKPAAQKENTANEETNGNANNNRNRGTNGHGHPHQHQHQHLDAAAPAFVPNPNTDGPVNAVQGTQGAPNAPRQNQRQPRNRNRKPAPAANGASEAGGPQASAAPTAPVAPAAPVAHNHNQRGGRRRAFGGQLTIGDGASESGGNNHGHNHQSHQQAYVPAYVPAAGEGDLTSQIHRDISTNSYECMVCYNDIGRKAKIWSCKCCWRVYHLHCITKWAKTAMEAPSRAPVGADGPLKQWRCPACNNASKELPGGYTCWCGKETQPRGDGYAPPHSCGQTCGKQLESPKKCPHSCTQQCHAGPCPPCTAMGPVQFCFCGKENKQKRCVDTDYEGGWSCGQCCGDVMPCGEHFCDRPCHPLLCGSCQVKELVKCYCGNEMREMKCGDKEDPRESQRYHEVEDDEEEDEEEELDEWTGFYQCGKTCERLLSCGVHRCSKPCHEQDIDPGICPTDPSVITHCPCGKTPLSSLLDSPRSNCEAPIPSCQKTCGKPLACGHPCTKICHAGDCGTCLRRVEILCRCTKTSHTTLCHQGELVEPPQCIRSCRVSLNCARHECGNKCCSGELKAAERLSTKRKLRPMNNNVGLQVDDGFEPEHICTRPCGRLLKCGIHNCSMLCHRGPCGSCLEASFEELSCNCGRTVIQPPVPCGSKPPPCRFPCTRPKPCGHPAVPHDCHPDEESCPNCPYLTEKSCLCGKKSIKAVPCWRDSASCGMLCGKTLSCGTHACRTPCHSGPCEEPCRQPCGKPRPSCGHPCVEPCHAPFQCSEDRPCPAKVALKCPCGGIKSEVKCAATKAKPAGNSKELACTDACRARRLAMALALDPEREAQIYSEDTLAAYQRDPKWAQGIEQKMRSFCEALEQKRLQFAPMKSGMRMFVHALAEDLGLQSESQDPEPYRSVVVRKPVTFVATARKTIAEVIAGGVGNPAAAANASAANGSATPSRTGTPSLTQLKRPARGPAVNAFYLRHIAVGTLSSDLERELSAVLKDSQLRFDITWHGDEDVLLKPKTGSLGPEQVEAELHGLSMKLKRLVASKGLADSAEMVWVGIDGKVKDGNTQTNASGWSTVVTQRRPVLVNKPVVASSNGFAVFATAEKKEKKKKEVKEVVDDWEMEADEEEEKEVGSGDEEGKEEGEQTEQAEEGMQGEQSEQSEQARQGEQVGQDEQNEQTQEEQVGNISEGPSDAHRNDEEASEDTPDKEDHKGKAKEILRDEALAVSEDTQETRETRDHQTTNADEIKDAKEESKEAKEAKV